MPLRSPSSDIFVYSFCLTPVPYPTKVEKMQNVNDIVALMASPSTSDIALVQKAYDFAQKAHDGHLRNSGEPYFNHLFETAKNLAQIGMGAQTIAAGFLHDSIEDVGVLPETIEKEFGKEVLFWLRV